MPDGLPTPRTTLRAQYVRVCLTCRACLRQRDADLEALISAGRGNTPLVQLRWRCSWCHSTRIDAVVMSKDSAVVKRPPSVERPKRRSVAPAGRRPPQGPPPVTERRQQHPIVPRRDSHHVDHPARSTIRRTGRLETPSMPVSSSTLPARPPH